MPVEVILPKVDMDMATGKISRWFVEEGAAVKQGEVLFEIETDKAAMEIDSPASGTIRNITGQEGVDLPVGSPVAWIYAEGEKAEPPPTSSLRGGREAEPSNGEAGGGISSSAGVSESPPLAPSLKGEEESGAVRATPLARRIAREKGLDLAAIPGSGPHGRVTRADVQLLCDLHRNPLDPHGASARAGLNLLPSGDRRVTARVGKAVVWRKRRAGAGFRPIGLSKCRPRGSFSA